MSKDGRVMELGMHCRETWHWFWRWSCL